MKTRLASVAMATTFALVSMAGCQTLPAQQRAGTDLAREVVGAWRLLSVESLRPNGEVLTNWMGARPTGIIQYQPDGLMAVQIMRDPSPGKFEAGHVFAGSPEEYKQAYLGYYAYWGSYSVGDTDNVVTHNVKASLWPQEVGIIYKRSAQFDGGRLVLTTPAYKWAGEDRKNRLTWERVK